MQNAVGIEKAPIGGAGQVATRKSTGLADVSFAGYVAALIRGERLFPCGDGANRMQADGAAISTSNNR